MSGSPRKILGSHENVRLGSAKGPVATKVGPPKTPRTAFMCFTDAKKHEILGIDKSAGKADILKIVAAEWKVLSDRERAYWDEEARNDKVRYVREKAEYTGPWNHVKRRAKKHPLAPKRPMSAFLKYSQKRRSVVKEENPDMSNTDVSRLLGEMWRTASAAEKAPYVEQELVEREKYKAVIKKFREEQTKRDAESRTSHQSIQQAAEKPPPSQHRPYDYSSFVQPLESFEPFPDDSVDSGASSADRRVFRSYGGGVPPESKSYKIDPRAFHATYGHSEAVPFASQSKSDGRLYLPYQHAQTAGQLYRPDSARSTKAEPSNPPRQTRPSYKNEENRHLAQTNAAPGPHMPQFDPFYSEGTVNMHGSFPDPDPPFNPRQQRPTSSHYFPPDNFYHYP